MPTHNTTAESSLYSKLVECGPLALCSCKDAKAKSDTEKADNKDKDKSIKDLVDPSAGKLPCSKGEALTLAKWSPHPSGGCSSICKYIAMLFDLFWGVIPTGAA
jgi:hypothetical protein